MKKCLIFSFLFLSIFLSSFSQEKNQYIRKSISYYEGILPLNKKVNLTDWQKKILIEQISKQMKMERFDFNPIPEKVMENFKSRIDKAGNLSLDEFNDLMNNHLVSEILKIVDLNKEARAKNLLTEAQMNSFLSDKAKELGITAEQLKIVMNSAYIYAPVIEEISVSKTGKYLNTTINVGLVWYKIDPDKGQAILLKKKKVSGTMIANETNSYKIDGKSATVEEYCFYVAAEVAAKNLLVATQEIPDFSLLTEIAEMKNKNLAEIYLGKKEGIHVDDKFFIQEKILKSDGSIEKETVGWGLVTKIADNRNDSNNKSQLKIIKGNDIERGMLLKEYPRMPFNLIVSGLVDITDTKMEISDYFSSITAELSTAIGAQAILAMNFGRLAEINQMYLYLGYALGVGKIDYKINYWGMTDSKSYTYIMQNLNIGLLKKFYGHGYAFSLGCDFNIKVTTWTVDEEPKTDNALYAYGFGLFGGLEFPVSPSLNIGLNCKYNPFPDYEKIEINEVEYDLPTKVPASSLTLGIYFDFSLPRLGFDPVKLIGAI